MAKQEKNQQAQTEHSQAGAVIEMLTERGYLGNQEINDAKLRDARQEKQKAAYHNTLMLLKQYRNIAWMLECFPDTIAEELEQPFTNLDELIDRVDVEMAMDNRKLEGRISNNNKVPVVIKASREEQEMITTDRAELEALLKERQQEQNV